MTINTTLPLIPLQPQVQWQEVFEWNTDIQKSNDGSEMRAKLVNRPKVTVMAEYPFKKAMSQLINNLLFNKLQGQMVVPLWTDAYYVGIISSSATTITNNPSALTTYCEAILIWESAAKYEVLAVTGISGDDILLDSPVENVYSRAIVMPVAVGISNSGIVRATTGYDGLVKTTYRILNYPAINAYDYPMTGIPDYRNLELTLNDQMFPNNGQIQEDILGRFDEASNNIAPSIFHTPWVKPQPSRIFTWRNENFEDTFRFKQWLFRRSGKYKCYWQPTFEEDFRLNQTGLLGNVLTCVENGYDGFPQDIIIFLKNGDYLPTRINSIYRPDSSTMELTIEDTFYSNVNDVLYISYLRLRRLDTDRVELYYTGNGKSFASLRVVEVDDPVTYGGSA